MFLVADRYDDLDPRVERPPYRDRDAGRGSEEG
jgi:hypothetical protein